MKPQKTKYMVPDPETLVKLVKKIQNVDLF